MGPNEEVIKDNRAVLAFCRKMMGKMEKSREKGRKGWEKDDCSSHILADQFLEHLNKTNEGNFVDLANYLMMLDQKGADPSILVNAMRSDNDEL